jgi:hypothetical protein
VNIVLGQLGVLLGSRQKGSPALVKAFNVVTHPTGMSLIAATVGGEVTILDVYGSLLFAGAQTLQTRLPEIGAARASGGHPFLSGVEPNLNDQLRAGRRLDLADAVPDVPAAGTVLESMLRACDEAQTWLAAPPDLTADSVARAAGHPTVTSYPKVVQSAFGFVGRYSSVSSAARGAPRGAVRSSRWCRSDLRVRGRAARQRGAG